MKAKVLLLVLILLSFSAVGCVGDDETPDATDALNETTEDITNETVPEDTNAVNETVEEGDVTEDAAEDDTATEDDDELKVTESEDPAIYTIRMENFLVQPSNITIDAGDTIVWRNINNPSRIFTLVSEDGLWENTSIANKRTFTYEFTETGNYSYYVLGWEARMKGTITVK